MSNFIVGIVITFTCRLLFAKEFYSEFGQFAFVIKSLWMPVTTLGFGVIAINLLYSDSLFNKILSTKIFQFIGRISYSMYLWHWIITYNLSMLLLKHYSTNNIMLEISFLTSLIILIPVSYISLLYLEAPYFKKK